MLENLNISLDFLQKKCGLKLVAIGNRSLHDGDTTLTLGLVWSLILHFQVECIEVDASGETEAEHKLEDAEGREETTKADEAATTPETPKKKVSGKKALLLWAKAHTKSELISVDHVEVKNLHKSWRDGFAFNALISHFRPDLVDMDIVKSMSSDEDRLRHAFEVGTRDLGLPALLDPQDILGGSRPDEKAITTYLAELFKLFSKTVPTPKKEISKKKKKPKPVLVRQSRRVPDSRPPSEAVKRDVRRIDRNANAAKAMIGTALVVDMGTSMLRVGFSGDEGPRIEDPVIVGRPYLPMVPEVGIKALGFTFDDEEADMEEEEEEEEDVFVGPSAVMTSNRGVLRLSSPMSRGVVTNWDDMERIWEATYDKLEETESKETIVHEAPLNPTRHKERIATVHFEAFDVPALLMAPPAGYLSLLYNGHTTGIGLDSGAEVTHVVGVMDGTIMTPSLRRYEWGGRDITSTLIHRLNQLGRWRASHRQGLNPSSWQHRYVVDTFKSKYARVYDKDDSTDSEGDVDCVLPDGAPIRVSRDAFNVSGEYFSDSDMESTTKSVNRSVGNERDFAEIPSVDEMIRISTKTVEDAIARKMMSEHMMISGGNTLVDGLISRLEAKVGQSIIAPSHRANAAFGGASLLYELRCFRLQFVTRGAYDEYGASGLFARGMLL